jgi:hypothetical protein
MLTWSVSTVSARSGYAPTFIRAASKLIRSFTQVEGRLLVTAVSLPA